MVVVKKHRRMEYICCSRESQEQQVGFMWHEVDGWMASRRYYRSVSAAVATAAAPAPGPKGDALTVN